MPDHGANAVDQGERAVDATLTPRLAARFERALEADEAGRAREVPADVRARRRGGGLFEAAMTAHAQTPAIGPAREERASHPATLRAMARAARAHGHEILAAREHARETTREAAREETREAIVDAASASVLDEPRLAAATTAPAMLEAAVEACTQRAERAGTAATLRQFAADVHGGAARLAPVALGVLVLTPDVDGSATRATFPMGQRLARARQAIALRATRAAAVAQAGAAARAATVDLIERERVARRTEAERSRRRALDELERRRADERARVEERARAEHTEAIERTRVSTQRSEDNAQHDRLAAYATLRDARLRAIDQAVAAYERAIAGRFDGVDTVHARWELAVVALDEIEDAGDRRALLEKGLAQHTRAVADARLWADAIEQAARDERDRRIAAATAQDDTDTAAIDARYEAARERAQQAHRRAVELADAALHRARSAFDAEIAAARASIEADAAAAIAAADAEAARRIERDVPAAGDAAERARDAAIAAELAALTELGTRGAR
ncbi:MAG TPA: hypothetical protein VM261_14275 [Kofleriaceae bacterium]|nr:hypothetical protein [Kofleriaceae bacterium]